MNNNLMQDVGENYEYLRTILNNTIELKKIEVSETISILLGKVVLSLVAVLVSSIVTVGLSIICVIWLAAILGSMIQAIAIMCGVFIFLLIVVYLFRERLMYRPCMNFVNSLMTFENID